MVIPGDSRVRAGLEGSAKANGEMKTGAYERQDGEADPETMTATA